MYEREREGGREGEGGEGGGACNQSNNNVIKKLCCLKFELLDDLNIMFPSKK